MGRIVVIRVKPEQVKATAAAVAKAAKDAGKTVKQVTVKVPRK